MRIAVPVGVQRGPDEDANDLPGAERQDGGAAHAWPEGVVTVEANESIRAVREGREHGLGKMAGGISGHECAVTRPGKGSGKDRECASGSGVQSDSDSGVDAKPVDVSQPGHLLEPLCDPHNMGDVAVASGDVD
jgi:hypothetical protein